MKTGFHKCTLQLQVRAASECPRCDLSVSSESPNCGQCGLWLPWGDEVIAAARARRRLAYIEREQQEEMEWERMRRDAQSHANPEALRYRVQRSLHLFSLRPVRVATAAIGASTALLITGLTISQALPHKTPRARDVATGRCADGTWTYALNRSGACSGHGGVKVFYK